MKVTDLCAGQKRQGLRSALYVVQAARHGGAPIRDVKHMLYAQATHLRDALRLAHEGALAGDDVVGEVLLQQVQQCCALDAAGLHLCPTSDVSPERLGY